MDLTPKIRKTLDMGLRLFIAASAISYLVYRISILPPGQMRVFFEHSLAAHNTIPLFTALLLLLPVNWGIESLKWKLLVGRSEQISFGTAFLGVLGGLATSVFTPNRVGEFIGRVFILKKSDPLEGILLTLVGSFSQMLVTLSLGTLAYLFFAPVYMPGILPESTLLVRAFSGTLIALVLLLIFFYFNIPALRRISLLLPGKFAERLSRGIRSLAACPKPLLLKTLLLSTVRYLVFLIQFCLAIRLFGLPFPIRDCLLVIPVIYLVLLAIPTMALTEIGVRGSVSVFLFGLLCGPAGLDSSQELAVLSASTLIWLVNIALPSLAGVFVIFRLNFFRR
jgi:hypothetical protein